MKSFWSKYTELKRKSEEMLANRLYAYRNTEEPDSQRNQSGQDTSASSTTAAAGFSATDSAGRSAAQAAETFSKPKQYNRDARKLYSDGEAIKNVKKQSFERNGRPVDPYTGDELVLTKAEAKLRFGADWQKHLAEGDHIHPLERVFKDHKDNPWLKNKDIRDAANSSDNMQTVSRAFNNPKRSSTNEEFVTNDPLLEKKDIHLTDESKQKAIDTGHTAKQVVDGDLRRATAKNVIQTGHHAGVHAAHSASVTTATMSGILNLSAVIKGEKTAGEALSETIEDTGKAAAMGYLMGGGLTTVSHTLSSSSSQFIRALTESNVPGTVITAVIMTGYTLKRYGSGEISTRQCMIELGDKGLTFATAGYSMAVGQALIPIPIVGAAVGALVGSMATSNYYYSLVKKLEDRELEHLERQRIIAESELAVKLERAFRAELEAYLKEYFTDYQNCFDEALTTIDTAFRAGNADGVISGANQITRKLGGNVYYDTVDEFVQFLNSDTVDIF